MRGNHLNAYLGIGLLLASLSPALADELRARVERERQLRFQRNVPTQEVTRDELRAFQAENFRNQYGDGSATQKELAALGLISRSVDFRQAVLGNKASGVQGFYIFKSVGSFSEGNMFTIPENIRGRGSAREVEAHELAHALSDQHHDLEAMFERVPKTPTGDRHADRSRALFSLEEGVATFVGKASDRRGLEVEPADWRGLEFLKARTQFLYTQGAEFAEHLHREGGWDAVNRAYEHPPTSTEQIMHPERYLGQQDKPTRVLVPNLARALPGFRPVKANTLGEFGLAWMVGRDGASGWDGDRYVVIENPQTGQVVSTLSTTWDSKRDAAEFHAAMSDTLRGPMASLKTGESLYIERDREGNVFTIAGASDAQIPALREALSRTRLRTEPGDRNVPGKPPEGEDLLRQIVSASSGGESLLTKSEGGIERVLTLEPTPAGEELVRSMLEKLATMAKARRLGKDRYLIEGEQALLVDYKDGVLTVGVGSSLAALEDVEGRLDQLGPSKSSSDIAKGSPSSAQRKGIIQALGPR